MKDFQYKPINKFNDNNLIERIHSDFKLCELSEEIQRGLMFFMGAASTLEFKDNRVAKSMPAVDNYDSLLRCLNLYSSSTGDFSNYGELNDYLISKWIYNANYIIHNQLNENDNYLHSSLSSKILPNGQPMTIGKTELDSTFLDHYTNCGNSLNVLHNLNEEFFFGLGNHMISVDYDNEKSYQAGIAYYFMQINLDSNNTDFLIDSILKHLSPLYHAFFFYPILQAINPKILESNHLFSNVLQMIYGELEENLGSTIHSFHQGLFYETGTLNIKNEFNFKNGNEDELIFLVLLNSIRIRENNDLSHLQPFFINSEGNNLPYLNNIIVSKTEFINKILNLIYTKYDIRHDAPLGWNNRGDFIQFLALLFYESSFHAMLPKEIIEK